MDFIHSVCFTTDGTVALTLIFVIIARLLSRMVVVRPLSHVRRLEMISWCSGDGR